MSPTRIEDNISNSRRNIQATAAEGSLSFSPYLTNNKPTLHKTSSPLLYTKEFNQTPQIMKPNARRFNPIACISLAVILYVTATTPTIKNVNADLSDNSQLVPHHSTHSQAALFKDLSGPTSGKIQTLDVICGKNFMTVRAEFSGPFYGIVFSKGTYGQENCIYVKPNSGLTHAAFNVYYDQCGTKPDLQGKFYENTIVIQYGSDIIEAYDEAKRLRCEWFEAYEKPATFKPAIPVADLEVVEMNFQGDDIDCWMEIQEGSGPWSREVSKIVPVGQPMTIVVAINDYNGQFDMRVKSCVAHDGVQQPISLTDEYGCVLRPKMLTPFTKIKNPGGHKKATVLSYSRFLAFKFPDSMTVQIQCTVEVCRHGCADACQRVPSIAATTLQPELSLTAKWPSAPNQPAIEGPRQPQKRFQDSPPLPQNVVPVSESIQNENAMSGPYKPARVQFSQRQPAADDRSHTPSGGRNPFYGGANELMASDDMSSSDSNQQTSIINSVAPQHQQRRVNHQHQQDAPSGYRNEPQQRRAAQEPSLPSMLDGRIPQYLIPNSNSRRRTTTTSTTMAAPSSTTTTTTTSTTTTAPDTSTSTISPQAPAMDDNRSNPADETPEYSSNDDLLTRLSPNVADQSSSANNNNNKQSDGGDSEQTVTNEQQDNKAEASQVRPTLALLPTGDQQQDQSQRANPQQQDQTAPVESSSATDTNKSPSVQGNNDEAIVDSSKPNDNDNSGGSSLKTVEVEIPANEDPVRTLISSSPPSASNSNNNNPIQNGPFNSIRMSNVDLSANNGYNYENQDSRRGQDMSLGGSNSYKQQDYINEQVIQPRETLHAAAEKRNDKSDDTSNIEAMMANVKNRFGARSQPQSSVQSAQPAAAVAAFEPPANHHSNHQMSSVDSSQEVPIKEGSEVVNPDRVLIDRSDDSSTLTEVASESQSPSSVSSASDNNPSKPQQADSAAEPGSMSAEESSPAVSVDTSGGKVKPVVGTEELASGPVQIEDRIGVPAQHDSLEEALLKLQQQVPQSAALVSSQDNQRAQASEQKPAAAAAAVAEVALNNNKPDQRSDNVSEQPDVAIDRADVGADNNKQHFHSDGNAHQHQQQILKSSSSDRGIPSEMSQPFPNVHGQQKVIPDPSSSLNSRNQMLAQASNQEGSPSGIVKPDGQRPASQPSGQRQSAAAAQALQSAADSQQEQIQQEQIQQEQIMSSKPVAQITNVPINIGFPPSQIPAIQQLSQQLAYFQQQQQQQLQQQHQYTQQPRSTTTTTVKPARGRFSLLSPQAALQAVASRFLPKSSTQQPQYPKPQSPLPIAQPPQVYKLASEQQQKLFPSSIQPGRQVYLQQQGAQQQLAAQQYQLPPNRYAPQQSQQTYQKLVAQTGSNTMGSGLFGRLNNAAAQHSAQPQSLVRSRRSAMMPNGKRGSGEVGMTKSFMVVTGMDLAFSPNATETELPPILEGRRMVEDDIIYGVCMPVVSLTFVLTCAFWLFVFIFSFCMYMLIKSRRQRETDVPIEKR